MEQFWGDCLHEVEMVGGGTGTVVTIACVPHLIWNLIMAGVTFAGIVALAFVILGSYKLVTSGGDPDKLKSARQTIFYALLGLALVFLSVFIVKFIATVTGVECLNVDVIGFQACL